MSHVGRHIGRYRILEELGSGGMSVVYKGLDTALDREVAVKVLHPHLAGKEESRRRLAREAKAVAKLHHPNILEVFDFAVPEADEAYIVTEYIRGQTLKEYGAKQAFEPPEIAAMVIHEVAAALAHAHEAGIIHRDLKPENVMVRDDGLLKLMDFGIAKIIDRDDRMTMTGALVGSPAHMAPEIIEGEEAGPEADVFSLGTMLYLFATGRLPFSGANTTATLKKILDGVYEDPRQLVPTVSDELAEIIATCLARRPSERYPNATRLREALADYLAAVGFPRVSEELTSFFADPPSYRKQLVKRLTEHLVQRGEVFLGDKRPAKALSSLNQVLALDPSNERALLLLKQMNVSRQRQRRVVTGARVAGTAVVVAALALGGVRAYQWRTRPKDFIPQVEHPSDVVMPESAFTAVLYTPPPKAPDPTPAVKPELAAQPEPAKQVKLTKAEPPHPTRNKVPVTVQVRPFGAVSVDTGESDPEPGMVHQLELSPGLHRFTVTCDGCIPRQERVQVPPPDGTVHLLAQPKQSYVAFQIDPPDAVVRVGKESRAAKDTLANPIALSSPPGGSIGYVVHYEISKPGFDTLSGDERLAAGERRTVTGKLRAK